METDPDVTDAKIPGDDSITASSDSAKDDSGSSPASDTNLPLKDRKGEKCGEKATPAAEKWVDSLDLLNDSEQSEPGPPSQIDETLHNTLDPINDDSISATCDNKTDLTTTSNAATADDNKLDESTDEGSKDAAQVEEKLTIEENSVEKMDVCDDADPSKTSDDSKKDAIVDHQMSEEKEEISEVKDEISEEKDETSQEKFEATEEKSVTSEEKGEASEEKCEASEEKGEASEEKGETSKDKCETSEDKCETNEEKGEAREAISASKSENVQIDDDKISKDVEESALVSEDNSQEATKNKDDSPDESEKDKEEQQTNNIEYVELGDSIEDDDNQRQMFVSVNTESNDIGKENEHINNTESDVNPLFVEKESEASTKDDLLDEDPIGADLGTDSFITENQEGADEELCIIPDTERVISQAEKLAAISIQPLRDISEASTSIDDSSRPDQSKDIEAVTNKFVISKCNREDLQSCMQCVLKRKVKYTILKGSITQYVCNDACLENFKRENADNYVLTWEGEIRVKNLTNNQEVVKRSLDRKCVFCQKKTDDEETNLTWEIMDFCNEFCLFKYQKEVGSNCATCSTDVRSNALGKYCVRFGNDVRQFCSSHCLEEYKKGLKVCSYCQQDMSGNTDGFLAPVGDKGQFKDFCSQLCMEKYDIMTNDRPLKVDEGTKCSVCKTDKTITIEFVSDGNQNYFCSDRCFVAFSFVNNITSAKCSLCQRYFTTEVLEKYSMFYDNLQFSFCSNSCQNIYIIAHRKIVPCVWCKVKKYNFDMIRRYFKAGTILNMCSINCLSLFQVSVNAVHSKKTVCNYCDKRHQPMYHLTMSDATIRNFCSYACVMSFQNKFKKSPITLNSNVETYPVPAGEPKKNRKYGLTEATPSGKEVASSLPVISSVQSLANKNGNFSANSPNVTNRVGRPKTITTNQHLLNSNVEPQVKIKHHIIIKPAPVPDQKNVSTMCRLKTHHKATQAAKPLTVDKSMQTEEREAARILIPVPVPIYVPAPLPMYSIPVPYPLPFPIPIPIPIFIPTTRNSAKGIMKEIKKIQVKIPTDPYEAELLMMAEMVAGDKKEENTDSESDVDDNGGGDEGTFSPEPVDASNTFGDDMLQMALKMATELEEPAVDLEGALTANTITAPQGSEPQPEEAVDDPQPILQMTERQAAFRGRKRGSRGGKQQSTTKRRRLSQPVELPVISTQPVPPPEPAEKPDAHLCLKYTFGVNAWKQWVTTKNAELEKSTKYVKPFKTEILQLTGDELNYSLCLFVKEVRKPNGAEYAPDTIYYLCLGIQQYLFENGRIDNIFCDPYYEQFTDSLDEVARKFSVLYNDSHYIVTRVEEEHLWESKQLGAHSPHVLLSTLMFFNTKHFNLTVRTVQEHMQLSFSHIMKHWKRNPNQAGVARTPGSRNVLLRFYPPQTAMQNNTRKKKVYEQQENDENPLRCPVKLYEFYLSKCPESVKTRNDVFYLQPERSCVPDSPVWYSTTALPQEALEKMLHRVKMVKEINVALLTS